MAGCFWDWTRFGRLLLRALAVTAAVVALILVRPWVGMFIGSFRTSRAAIAFLVGLEVAYGTVLAAALIGFTVLGVIVYRARRGGMSRPWAARGLLMCGACLLALALAEAGAALWRASLHREPSLSASLPLLLPAESPELATEFSEPKGDSKVTLVVIGESSAAGVPFQTWTSVGQIVAWKLEEAIPGRRFQALVLAEPGTTLADQCRKLAGLRRRPDALIVYCGHNEFCGYIPWSRKVRHYRDEKTPFTWRLDDLARRGSPLCGLIQEAADKYRIAQVPTRFIQPPLIDVPAYTPGEFTVGLANFRRRLEAIVAFGEQVKAMPILVIPPSNDGGFEPNRSFMHPETSGAEREAFIADFKAARLVEASDPARAIEQYRDLLARQPGFAECHYRLGRLLKDAGEWAEAYQHFVAARDLDGMPMRCLTPFQHAYHDVAAQHDCALVDGQALFHALGPHGLLDDHLFQDAMHPSLGGHIALARAILEALRARRAWGWPSEVPTPTIEPAQCAVHFGMRPRDWKPLCEQTARFFQAAAGLRHDPSQRLASARALEVAAQRIGAGEPPETVGLPNVGIPAEWPAAPAAPAAPAVQKAPASPSSRTSGSGRPATSGFIAVASHQENVVVAHELSASLGAP